MQAVHQPAVVLMSMKVCPGLSEVTEALGLALEVVKLRSGKTLPSTFSSLA